MACFIVPATEAVVTTVANKVIKNNEKKSGKAAKNPFAEKLGQLNGMLWGGSGLLAFEHLWHGEIAPFFPFLTAASDPSDRSEMLFEMATSGSAMALTVTAVWAGMVLVTSKLGIAKKRGAEA
jgi:hypothetical protein